MKHSLPVFLLAGILLVSAPLTAQLAFGGKPYGRMAHRIGIPDAPVVTMPMVDANHCTATDADPAPRSVPVLAAVRLCTNPGAVVIVNRFEAALVPAAVDARTP